MNRRFRSYPAAKLDFLFSHTAIKKKTKPHQSHLFENDNIKVFSYTFVTTGNIIRIMRDCFVRMIRMNKKQNCNNQYRSEAYKSDTNIDHNGHSFRRKKNTTLNFMILPSYSVFHCLTVITLYCYMTFRGDEIRPGIDKPRYIAANRVKCRYAGSLIGA